MNYTGLEIEVLTQDIVESIEKMEKQLQEERLQAFIDHLSKELEN
jgi:hypothetical protein